MPHGRLPLAGGRPSLSRWKRSWTVCRVACTVVCSSSACRRAAARSASGIGSRFAPTPQHTREISTTRLRQTRGFMTAPVVSEGTESRPGGRPPGLCERVESRESPGGETLTFGRKRCLDWGGTRKCSRRVREPEYTGMTDPGGKNWHQAKCVRPAAGKGSPGKSLC